MNVPIVNRQADLLKKLIKDAGTHTEFIEIGCGEGHNLHVLSRMGLEGTGIDFSDEAIRLAKKRKMKNVSLVRSNLYDVKIKNKDLVLLLFVLEHIEDDKRALEKINSVLKLGGHLIISVPAHSKSYSFQDRLAGHYRRYDKKGIVRKLNNAGFRVRKHLSFGFPVSNIYAFIYNSALLFYKHNNVVVTENTKITGIMSKKSHFPYSFKAPSKIAFPILSFLIKLDFLFLDTDLGTHYIILARKARNISARVSE